MAEQIRLLRIKTGSCSRLLKDWKAYQEEEIAQRELIQRLKEQRANPSDLKQQENVLAETLTMLPDTRGRLEDAFLDLVAMLDEIDSNDSLQYVLSSVEWENALKVRHQLQPLFDTLS
eukprot:TRINITY_DN10766_c0_g1_i3.p1 TRINITY_DN10766_c0_g1~~TRINITY_DN10766_c0_g1_i3.p1  ORF type:complete len:118 (+),score=13.77 TRINITY_DN10766_c0_g1_i3:76-429(+)